MITSKHFFIIILIAATFLTLLFYWVMSVGLERVHSRSLSGNGGNQPEIQEQSAKQTSHEQQQTVAPTNNHLTKDFDEDLVVIYNRVPKTGSTSFINLSYDLCKKNKFHVLHINVTANMHVLSLPNQMSFVRNITNWHDMKPALYHGHMAFLDFSKFGAPYKPIYINLIRKPLDRLVSYYYFLRYGDNYRPHIIRKKSGDTMTFDECVEHNQPDCDPNNMWLQIPFFCGHHAECWVPGSEWALHQAKRNLANEYFLVGITEAMDSFISLLELSIPRIFKGSLDHYLNSNKSHLRQTTSKVQPNENTISKIQESDVWKMENELYEFAVDHFEFIQKKMVQPGKANLKQSFMYEKIRPKF